MVRSRGSQVKSTLGAWEFNINFSTAKLLEMADAERMSGV
jgi:hypothetical protein